jgi:hypothetical protein
MSRDSRTTRGLGVARFRRRTRSSRPEDTALAALKVLYVAANEVIERRILIAG